MKTQPAGILIVSYAVAGAAGAIAVWAGAGLLVGALLLWLGGAIVALALTAVVAARIRDEELIPCQDAELARAMAAWEADRLGVQPPNAARR